MIARLWHRIVAEFAFIDLRDLQSQRRYTARLIASLEIALKSATQPKRIAELQAALRIERAHAAGIDYAIRDTERTATQAAMLARI